MAYVTIPEIPMGAATSIFCLIITNCVLFLKHMHCYIPILAYPLRMSVLLPYCHTHLEKPMAIRASTGSLRIYTC